MRFRRFLWVSWRKPVKEFIGSRAAGFNRWLKSFVFYSFRAKREISNLIRRIHDTRSMLISFAGTRAYRCRHFCRRWPLREAGDSYAHFWKDARRRGDTPLYAHQPKGMQVGIINYGARIVSIVVPDRHGKMA